MRIVLIHGWRVRDAEGSIGVLAPHLERLGHEVVTESYGYVLSPWATRMKSRSFAKKLSTRLHPGDVVIGHSNGARIAWECSYYAEDLGPMVLLNPALDHDAVPGVSVPRCLVVYNRNDWVTRFARLIPGSVWGDMGTVGYREPEDSPWGPDERVESVERGAGHSPYHHGTQEWAEWIDEWVREVR